MGVCWRTAQASCSEMDSVSRRVGIASLLSEDASGDVLPVAARVGRTRRARRSWRLDRQEEAQARAETMAMPYGPGARLDTESPTPSGRRSPGTPICQEQVGKTKAPCP